MKKKKINCTTTAKDILKKHITRAVKKLKKLKGKKI